MRRMFGIVTSSIASVQTATFGRIEARILSDEGLNTRVVEQGAEVAQTHTVVGLARVDDVCESLNWFMIRVL